MHITQHRQTNAPGSDEGGAIRGECDPDDLVLDERERGGNRLALDQVNEYQARAAHRSNGARGMDSTPGSVRDSGSVHPRCAYR